ncbi:hypothetical protein C8Q74DRAFT_1394251 [Fomes fomentarius]|nr:hypothetical protein C8Q74DRAFT_1394251 [Fomes fomentarius]
MINLQPYRGTVRKLVVGFDVGTTYSGVAYAFLEPGELPVIHGVTWYPGQEHAASHSKIPSIIYYYPDGRLHSIGADAIRPGIEFEVEDYSLILLHLRLPGSTQDITTQIPPLPPGKTVVDVFADFFTYLFNCTRRFISETHANGDSIWRSVEGCIEYVLSHPNGWEGAQQAKLRQAAVMAGLIPDNDAGHAHENFCIQSGLTTDTLQDGKSVIIVDAGGGTIDLSSYVFVSITPMKIEEITSPDCVLQGSVFVSTRAGEYLKARLRGSQYGNEDDIRAMLRYFDVSTKPVFKDGGEASYIKFGSMRCNEPAFNIRRGQLKLDSTAMVSFFQPSLDAIIKAVKSQRNSASASVPSTVFLVGGFAANPWLYSSLRSKLNKLGFTLYRPDSHTNKAVAHGSVCFYLEHFVSARVAKMTYGVEIMVEYDNKNPEHRARSHTRITRPSGRVMLRNGFATLLKKGTCVRDGEELINSDSCCHEARQSNTLNSITLDILCYRGRESEPQWVDKEPELFPQLCTIYADTSQVVRDPRIGPSGVYYVQEFDIVLIGGMTELKAQLRWVQNVSKVRDVAV